MTAASASPWDILMRAPRHKPAAHEVDALHKPLSKAGIVRQLLEDHGPMRAYAILMDERLQIDSTGQLWACMKWDIHIGRISVVDGTYRLNDAFEDGISKAMALLKRNGYRVERTS